MIVGSIIGVLPQLTVLTRKTSVIARVVQRIVHVLIKEAP
jgi:hypothetical protein